MTAESPDLAAAKRLLDAAKRGGVSLRAGGAGSGRAAVGRAGDPPVARHHLPRRVQPGMHRHPARKSSLIVPGGPLVTQRLDGDALSVLHTVVCDWDP